MSDFTLQPRHTLVVGMTGSGKTTFVNRYLLNDDSAACRFIFDDLNRNVAAAAPEALLHQPPARGIPRDQMERLQPPPPLPRRHQDRLARWCRWVFHAASRGPGKKMVVIPELWRHCNPDSIPAELALSVQAGRELDVELIMDTQRPEQVNASITGAATELITFKLMSSEALRAVEKLWRDSGDHGGP